MERSNHHRASDKLSELPQFFQAGAVRSPEMLRFSELLFLKAPRDFLQQHTAPDLLVIAEATFQLFQSFVKSKEQLLVGLNFLPDTNCLCLVLEDRPFIVDTVLEYLHHAGTPPRILLHPILQDEGARHISLIYIELNIDFRDHLAGLEKVLAQLIHVTEDFDEMLSCCSTRAFSLREAQLDDTQEAADFLSWASEGGFILLGYQKWNVRSPGSALLPAASGLGLLRADDPFAQVALQDLVEKSSQILLGDSLVSVRKTYYRSPVHRTAYIDLITVLTVQTAAEPQCVVECFLGLLTNRALAHEAALVPIARQKLATLIASEALIPNSHDYKELVSIVDGIPKSLLFQLPVETLQEDIDLIMSSVRLQEPRISLHLDPLFRSVSLMVILPRSNFSARVRESIQECIEKEFGTAPGTAEYRLAVSGGTPVRLDYFLPNIDETKLRCDVAVLEQQIATIAASWDDHFTNALIGLHTPQRASQLAMFYQKLLPEQYKAATAPAEAAFDIRVLEALRVDNPLEITIRMAERSRADHLFQLKLYKRHDPLTLSSIIPYLENVGLEILDESATALVSEGFRIATIYVFSVRHRARTFPAPSTIDDIIIPGIKDIFAGNADNDYLNGLLFEPGLSTRRIAVLRALAQYLWQLNVFPSRSSLFQALVDNPSLAELLVRYFEAKFDPQRFVVLAERVQFLAALRGEFLLALKQVSHLTFDRILRALFNIIEALVRTNYYLPGKDSRVALKIDSKRITQMPAPRPLFEIFVSSPDFEGIHLRGGKVSRGGIRWSERSEDYRTEILGLMKTQMVKNSIIVPVGANGGFVLKHAPVDPASLQQRVRWCYSQFIHSLLEITDNRVPTGVKHPEHMLVYDEPDPYLVVASDKGTSTFSDLANEIAIKRFHFWLDDAFASGGSQGYRHKELGITARGAWEAGQRHFRELGIDVHTQEFTIVGIGDMAGDVFGNYLLLTKTAKVIAAFNHRDIFLDPNPDPHASYLERERLFHLPTSQWTDYNPLLVSRGGGVFRRDEKDIALSPEAQRALGCDEELLSGDELIQAILRAPVDLLFNGGIGTYVKASSETHIDVGDRANDDLRIDASELRARIVCEGGNLGFTQHARIEYASNGGHINTDAVDNSGGVDLSDFEVNVKILLSGPVRRGELGLDERNEVLQKCAPEAVKKVTARNRLQSKVLSLGVLRSKRHIDYYRGLIHYLVGEKLLDRKGEFLPDDESLAKRGQLKTGFTRPELAIIIAYVKMGLFNTMLGTDLRVEPFLRRYLLSYFPACIVERFREDTLRHPLAKEIISSQVANLLVERMGATFAYRVAEETGAAQTDIIFAFLAAGEIIGMNELNDQLRVMDTARTADSYLKALLAVTQALDDLSRWLLDHKTIHLTWSELIERYRNSCRILVAEAGSILTALDLERYERKRQEFVALGFPAPLAHLVCSIVYAPAYLEITDIASDTATELLSVARLYSVIASDFSVVTLLEQATRIEPCDRWEALAIRAIIVQLKQSIGQVTKAVIEEAGGASLEHLTQFMESRKEVVNRYRQSTAEFQNRALSIPAFLVIANQLHGLSRRGL